MGSETLEEKGSPDEGSPANEKDQESKEVENQGGEEEEEEEEEVKVAGKKRGRKPGGKGRGKKKVAAEEEEEGTPKVVRKRRRTREAAASGEAATTPERRTGRERKTVERFTVSSPARGSATKGVLIVEGKGTQLKDIPNVSHKLSKRRVDENLQNLHTLLFAKRGKVNYVKRNILKFSGFVWTENEEKQRARVKERLDKFNKDKLLDFCDLLDIAVLKATDKKEDILTKILTFLESPHITRDVILADSEEKLKRRKRRGKTSNEASEEKSKKSKKSREASEVKKGQRHTSEDHVEDVGEGESSGSEHSSKEEHDSGEMEGESDRAKMESEDEKPELKKPVERKKATSKEQKKKSTESKIKPLPSKKVSPAKPVKSPLTSDSEKEAEDSDGVSESDDDKEPPEPVESKKKSTNKNDKGVKGKVKADPVRKGSTSKSSKNPSKSNLRTDENDDSDPQPPSKSKASARKNQNQDSRSTSVWDKVKKKEPVKDSKASAKEAGKGKASRKPKTEPTREEMYAVVSDILKEVDFNVATFSHVLKQLEKHFKRELMHRKGEVKDILEEVIQNMTDDEEEEDEGGKKGSDDDSDE